MDKLSQFVNEQIKRGVDPSELKAHLAKNGWNDRDINTAIANATGRSTRRNIALVMVGIIVVAVLAYSLISLVDTTKPGPVNQPNNNDQGTDADGQNMQTNTPSVQGCSDKEDSIEKDSCYRILVRNRFDCRTLTDAVELTSCNRANEELMLKGVETIQES